MRLGESCRNSGGLGYGRSAAFRRRGHLSGGKDLGLRHLEVSVLTILRESCKNSGVLGYGRSATVRRRGHLSGGKELWLTHSTVSVSTVRATIGESCRDLSDAQFLLGFHRVTPGSQG